MECGTPKGQHYELNEAQKFTISCVMRLVGHHAFLKKEKKKEVFFFQLRKETGGADGSLNTGLVSNYLNAFKY